VGGSCLVEVAGYEVEVVDSRLWQASAGEGRLRVSLPLLRLDAAASVAGERLAGFMLLPYTTIRCPGRLSEALEEVTAEYRRRVSVEQYYDLAVRMGPLVREAGIDPAYPAASRLWLLRAAHSCLASSAGAGALEEARNAYASLLPGNARLEGGRVRLDPLGLRREFRGLAARVRSALAAVHSRVPLPRLPWEGDCRLPEPYSKPWIMASLPEGSYEGPCRDPLELVPGGECRAGGRLSSTLICRLPGGGLAALKDYVRMAFKWIPAAAASSVAVRYRLGPRSRLAADYRYLRELRGVLPTPRVLRVCSDIARAAALREYVEGTPVLDSRDPRHWRLAGAAIGRVHEAGYALGDANPGNFVAPSGGGGPWLVDAEQARRYTVRAAAWDLVVALAYAAFFNVAETLLAELVAGYLDSWPQAPRVAREALSPALWMPLQAAPRAARSRRILRRMLQ
jgi:tRNA A-37 threonylcarbamoyl transferase component Bud32